MQGDDAASDNNRAGYLLHGLLLCAYEVGIMDHAFNRKGL